MFAYCNNTPVCLTDELGESSIYVTVAEDQANIYGYYYIISVSVSVKAEDVKVNDYTPCSVSIGSNQIDIAYEGNYVQYSFGIDENNIFAGVGCVFDKTAYSLNGPVLGHRDLLTFSFEKEVADGIVLEVDISITPLNKGISYSALNRAAPALASIGAAGLAFAGGSRFRCGGRLIVPCYLIY